jgi:hypothetical protein
MGSLLDSGSRLKRLTAPEMATKCERGECYNCTEKFSLDHLKVCPMKGIYLLYMENKVPFQEDEEDNLSESALLLALSEC